MTLDSSSRITFSDEGDVVTHFQARGVMFGKDRLDTTAIEKIAKKYATSFLSKRELKISGPIKESHKLFANFLKALLEIMDWELDFLKRQETEAQPQ